MWRLTIYQKKITKYMAEGQEKSLETEESVTFEHEAVEALLLIVARLSSLVTGTGIRFEIRKVADVKCVKEGAAE